MADRGADATTLSNLGARASSPAWLVEVALDSGTVRMARTRRSVAWGGYTWTANGHYLGFSGLTESSDMQIPTVQVSVSAVDQSWVAIVLAQNTFRRPLRIYKAFVDAAATVQGTPILVFPGLIDDTHIEDDPDSGKSIIQVSTINELGDFARRAGRHTNDAEQQAVYPGDKFFALNTDYNRQLRWGPAR